MSDAKVVWEGSIVRAVEWTDEEDGEHGVTLEIATGRDRTGARRWEDIAEIEDFGCLRRAAKELGKAVLERAQSKLKVAPIDIQHGDALPPPKVSLPRKG